VGTYTGIPGGWGLRWELGARRPSNRDKAIVQPLLDELRRRGAARPLTWLVVDDPTPNAQVIGQTVYVHSGLVGHPSLTAVLAHECGHAATSSAKVLLALIRLEVPGLRSLRTYLDFSGWTWPARVVRIISGGASWELPVISNLWRGYFKRSEHRADEWAKRYGYGHELAAYLDVYDRPIDAASPFGLGRTHPYAEQRIGRLSH
jgi:Zn-dependent protease with chaperone function